MNYETLKKKLTDNSAKNVYGIKDLDDLNNKIKALLTKNTPTDITKEKIVNQYEEVKDNITFGTLIENINQKYNVYIIIFDDNFIYSNILKKEYDNIDEAQVYFEELKINIKDKNIDLLSQFILNNM